MTLAKFQTYLDNFNRPPPLPFNFQYLISTHEPTPSGNFLTISLTPRRDRDSVHSTVQV